eukprot:12913717-Ditylum_brightwellii.AAC.1
MPPYLWIRLTPNDMDTPNYWQAMHQPDADQFEAAMDVEWEVLEGLRAWEIIDTADVPLTPDGQCCT